MPSKAQNEMLREALRMRPMTATEIWHDLGIARASARVFDLRQAGHDVRSEEITVTNRHGQPCRVARYSIPSDQCQLIPLSPGRGVIAP
ncbi:hypothetical protein DYQ93_11615 [Xanthomonas sp. LMG 8992]|uniref:helix-turn-helix domain-containing protein n=1 Tax=Xanthomonas sp. LMG 8992 TaxID=1591157 RepID=UPI00136CA978|nr:helix-turn-helix domain-containing protein [Xanthomonas sp. LMG 8992]MXV11668.1 hypothetical protein [Xanthomonas sp. LMG 8992]